MSRPTSAQRLTQEWTVGLGLSLGTPGGPGLLAEVRPVSRMGIRGVLRGVSGDVPRGLGLTLGVLQGASGRIFISAGAGGIRCIGDPDGVCSGDPTETTFALSVGLGGEFPVTTRGDLAVGLEVERWHATRLQRSLNAAVFVLRVHL